MNLKFFKICLISSFIICLLLPTFAEEKDWSAYDKEKYEWYKENDKWRCKKEGKDLVSTREEIGYNTYEFDCDGYAIGNTLVLAIDGVHYYLYDKDINPVANEYFKKDGNEYYTTPTGSIYRILKESDKNANHPKYYLDLDASNMDVDKARQERDQEAANEVAFLSFVNDNTEKKTELIFEPYKLGDVILNADGTVTNVKTGDLIRNKAISYEWTSYDEYFGKDLVYTCKILLDGDGNRVSGYYLYGNTVYRFNTSNQHEFRYIVTDAKEKANALAELDAKKNGYSIVSENSSNSKPVFSEIDGPIAQYK